jgi:hypothetical protein
MVHWVKNLLSTYVNPFRRGSFCAYVPPIHNRWAGGRANTELLAIRRRRRYRPCTLQTDPISVIYPTLKRPNLHWILLQVDLHLDITNSVSQITSLSQKASWSRETAMQYPRHVSIFRGASPYARLAQPDALHNLVHARPAPSYSIETPTEAFNVTKYGGIIYVSNTNALLEAPSTLKWVLKL